jgi:hypothetical protein
MVQLSADLGMFFCIQPPADDTGPAEHHKDNGPDNIGQLQGLDGFRGIGPMLGRVIAKPRQEGEGDTDGKGRGDLGRQGIEGLDQADPLLALVQTDLIAHIGEHGPDH